MRKPIVLAALVAGAGIALWASPSSAVQRVADPSDANSLLARTADVERTAARRAGKKRHARVYREGRGEYWHYRLSAGRWLHQQYVNAGYPAQRYAGEVTYAAFPGGYCCGYRRHWPWMGYHRHHHHHHR